MASLFSTSSFVTSHCFELKLTMHIFEVPLLTGVEVVVYSSFFIDNSDVTIVWILVLKMGLSTASRDSTLKLLLSLYNHLRAMT